MSQTLAAAPPPEKTAAGEGPFNLAQLNELANRYAPITRFHPAERYFMCTMEWYLERSTLYGLDGSVKHSPTVADLPAGDLDDGKYWLKMNEAVKPGDLSIARTYVHAYWQPGTDYTDLQYWFCYGYNGPGTLHVYNIFDSSDVDLAPLGEHWIDWEQMTIRIKNDTREVLGVFLSQHGEGDWITDLKRFQRKNDQFIIYASKNGHALYTRPDTNPTNGFDAKVLGFYLRNDTADGGQSFDSAGRLEIVSANFIPEVKEPGWLHFPYRYGAGEDSHLSRGQVSKMLKGLLGPIGWLLSLLTDSILSGLVDAIMPVITFDDTNGVYGPQTQSYWTSRLIPKFNIHNGYTDYTTNTDSPPCISWFKGLYHIFFKDRNGTGIMHITSPDGITWSRPASFYTGHTTSAGPCSVVFEGMLHVFFRDGAGNRILHIRSTDGDKWEAAPRFYIGLNCDGQPSAAVLGNRLCVTAIDHNGYGIMLAVITGLDGEWANGYSNYTTNHSSPPCLVVFKNAFHLFFQDHNGQGIMHILSADGVNWSRAELFYTGFNTSAGPTAILFDKLLYIMFRDGTGNGILYIQSADGEGWSPAPCWYIGLNCDLEPRIAATPGDGEMCLACIDGNGHGIMRAVFNLW